MSLIRYVALLALVVWLGGMVTLSLLAGASAGDVLRQFHWLAYACGGLMLACLVMIKFLGPPPRAFVPRASLVVLMLAITIYSGTVRAASTALTIVNIALGLALLAWYVREEQD